MSRGGVSVGLQGKLFPSAQMELGALGMQLWLQGAFPSAEVLEKNLVLR